MKRLESMPTEQLAREHADAESALRFASFHGAAVPPEAYKALKAMATELESRSDRPAPETKSSFGE